MNCPQCGSQVIYVGLNNVECSNSKDLCMNGIPVKVDWKKLLMEAVRKSLTTTGRTGGPPSNFLEESKCSE